MAACIAPRNQTLTDEAYAQHFSTGSANRGSNTFNSHSGGSALITAAIMAAPALCRAIDQSRSQSERTSRCNELFRHLSNSDAAAHEWQSYYIRCQKI
jgi:hypothetical protein